MPKEPTKTRRTLGLLTAIACGGVLVLAGWMDPSAEGLGTHEQLNLPPCGWIAVMDLPCPTCGMTTAFAHAADGELWASFVTQPVGAVLAIGTAMAFLIGLFTLFTGSRLATVLPRLWGPRTGWWLALGLLAAWVYKVISYRV